MEEYNTIKAQAQIEYIQKRSRFLGFIKPIQHEGEATTFIDEISRSFRDASHVVYAYILREGNTRRFSDAGEPQGTAGMPSLEVLQKNELWDVVLVIVRYFGGVLLGAGGLVRAYSHTASLAVSAAGIVTMKKAVVARANLPYSLFEPVKELIGRFGGSIVSSEFLGEVNILFYIEEKKYEAFIKDLNDITGAAVKPVVKERNYAQFEKN